MGYVVAFGVNLLRRCELFFLALLVTVFFFGLCGLVSNWLSNPLGGDLPSSVVLVSDCFLIKDADRDPYDNLFPPGDNINTW